MNRESEILSEIKRQGRRTRWTLVLCCAVLAFLVGVSSFGLDFTVRVGLSTVFLGMFAVFVVAIIHSIATRQKENTHTEPNSNHLKTIPSSEPGGAGQPDNHPENS